MGHLYHSKPLSSGILRGKSKKPEHGVTSYQMMPRSIVVHGELLGSFVLQNALDPGREKCWDHVGPWPSARSRTIPSIFGSPGGQP